MLFLKTRGFVLGFVTALLWPATAFAQVPTAPLAASTPQVQIKVDFVTVGSADLTADLAKSGLNFDRVPLVPPAGTLSQPETFLRYMAGDAATHLFQTLARMGSKSVQSPVITTTDGVSATIQVNTQVLDGQKNPLTLQAGLVITPRINTDDSITLYVGLQTTAAGVGTPLAEPQETTLRTIRSGDMMVVDGLPLGGIRPINGHKLLIFIEPLLIGAGTQGANAGRPAPSLLPRRGASPATGKTVTLDVFNADLHTVVAMLERQMHLDASVRDAGNVYKPVDVHLSGASLPEALGAIARSAGAQIIRDEHGVYVFSPLPGAVLMPTPKAPVGDGSTVTVTP